MNRKETTCRAIVWTVLAIGAVCFGGDFSCGGVETTDPPSDPPPDPPTASGTMRGHVKLEVTVPIPEDKRALTLENRAAIEEMGYTVAEDGSGVAFAAISPAGW